MLRFLIIFFDSLSVTEDYYADLRIDYSKSGVEAL